MRPSRPAPKGAEAQPREARSGALRRIVGVLLSLAALSTMPAHADSMHCGVNLVVVGDYKAEVEDACGKPNNRESHFIDGAFQVRDRFGRRYFVEGIRVETWTYRFGPQRFSRILRFENDRLVRIDKARRRL